eukprot:1946640-Rhodomonas_salina.1
MTQPSRMTRQGFTPAKTGGRMQSSPAVQSRLSARSPKDDHSLLSWVNETIGEAFETAEELHDGVAFCMLADKLFYGKFPLQKVIM